MIYFLFYFFFFFGPGLSSFWKKKWSSIVIFNIYFIQFYNNNFEIHNFYIHRNFIAINQLHQGTAFHTRLHVCPATIQISLHICASFALIRFRCPPEEALGTWLPTKFANEQADLSLRLALVQSCTKCFAMTRFIIQCITFPDINFPAMISPKWWFCYGMYSFLCSSG